MRIAVVILNWNGVALLRKFLPAVVQHSGDAAIYLADNASTDESVQYVISEWPDVRIIINAGNYGFASGYNEALKKVDSDIYILLNSDVEVTAGWLAPIIRTFENEPKTAIIQPKILAYNQKTHFEYAGAGGGYIDRYGYPFCRGRVFETLEQDQGQYDTDVEIFWASGACFAIRKTVFDNLEGFDSDFFAHQEEIDLCWRSFNAAHTTKFVHQSVVYHVGGATLNTSSPTKTYLNFRNSLLMLSKNLPRNSVFLILMIRMLLDGIAGLRFLSQGKGLHFAAVIRAHFVFYSMFTSNFRKRSGVQQPNYFKVNSIVYDYFAKGRKTFKRLF